MNVNIASAAPNAFMHMMMCMHADRVSRSHWRM